MGHGGSCEGCLQFRASSTRSAFEVPHESLGRRIGPCFALDRERALAYGAEKAADAVREPEVLQRTTSNVDDIFEDDRALACRCFAWSPNMPYAFPRFPSVRATLTSPPLVRNASRLARERGRLKR